MLRKGLMLLAVPLAGVLGGCTSISVDPDCPTVMQVGEVVQLEANQRNPGAIATYTWEVSPRDAGAFGSSTEPITSFQALQEGELAIRLTGRDGLYQDQEICYITVSGALATATEFVASLNPVEVGGLVMLTCQSVGQVDLDTFSVAQTGGPDVVLTETGPGSWAFIAPDEATDLSFSCVGALGDGQTTEPNLLTVVVTGGSGDPGVLDIPVDFQAAPIPTETGVLVTLACLTHVPGVLDTFAVEQTGGVEVTIDEVIPGLWTFVTPNSPVELEFACVGANAAGQQTLPVLVTVSVVQGSDDEPEDGDGGG